MFKYRVNDLTFKGLNIILTQNLLNSMKHLLFCILGQGMMAVPVSIDPTTMQPLQLVYQ